MLNSNKYIFMTLVICALYSANTLSKVWVGGSEGAAYDLRGTWNESNKDGCNQDRAGFSCFEKGPMTPAYYPDDVSQTQGYGEEGTCQAHGEVEAYKIWYCNPLGEGTI